MINHKLWNVIYSKASFLIKWSHILSLLLFKHHLFIFYSRKYILFPTLSIHRWYKIKFQHYSLPFSLSHLMHLPVQSIFCSLHSKSYSGFPDNQVTFSQSHANFEKSAYYFIYIWQILCSCIYLTLKLVTAQYREFFQLV